MESVHCGPRVVRAVLLRRLAPIGENIFGRPVYRYSVVEKSGVTTGRGAIVSQAQVDTWKADGITVCVEGGLFS